MNLATKTSASHIVIDPSILYFGTPVVLITSLNPDGSSNIMPMSSAFWLGHSGVLGVGTRSQTAANLRRNPECVLNLPSVDLVSQVNSLALTTGKVDLAPAEAAMGYSHVADKFGHSGFTGQAAETVSALRIAECPVNLEAQVTATHEMAGGTMLFEVDVSRVHVHEAIRMDGAENRIDPDAWRPLIMSFQKFYGLGDQVHPSRLSTIDEEFYR